MNWAALGFGTFLGVTNIGLMGSLISKGNLPVVDFPVGSYTSYEMEATKDGYKIRYNANDPKVMVKTENVVKPSSGLFSKGQTTVDLYEEYTMNGKVHLDGGDDASKLTAKEIACIKTILNNVASFSLYPNLEAFFLNLCAGSIIGSNDNTTVPQCIPTSFLLFRSLPI